MGISIKTRKTRLSIVKRFFAKQHYQWGKVQKFVGRIRVKQRKKERASFFFFSCSHALCFFSLISKVTGKCISTTPAVFATVAQQ